MDLFRYSRRFSPQFSSLCFLTKTKPDLRRDCVKNNCSARENPRLTGNTGRDLLRRGASCSRSVHADAERGTRARRTCRFMLTKRSLRPRATSWVLLLAVANRLNSSTLYARKCGSPLVRLRSCTIRHGHTREKGWEREPPQPLEQRCRFELEFQTAV